MPETDRTGKQMCWALCRDRMSRAECPRMEQAGIIDIPEFPAASPAMPTR
jgi:hypothetical protein